MRTTLWFGVFAFAIGCGSDSSKPSVSTNKGNVCDQIAAVACYDLYTCCTEGEIEATLNVSDPRSEDQCKQDISKECERKFADQEASLAAGRVSFDSSIANTCLKAVLLPSNTCATVADMQPYVMACMDSPWVGQVAAGGMCFFTYECANPGTQFCAPNQTCTALPTDGQPCAPGNVCAAGSFCNGGTCRAQLGPGGQCQSNTQCMKNLFCDFSQPTPICAALKNGGDTCTSNAACVSGVCNPGTCAGTGNFCYTSSQCSKHCSNTNNFCNLDSDCGIGHCSVTTTTSCFQPTSCPAGETCVLPGTCLASTCTGNIVCSTTEVTVDYCTGAIGALPLTP